MNENYIPETLEQCKQYYLPPIKKYITCSDFGNPDGMNGSCHWCLEMCPYQFEMCHDESLLRNLIKNKSKDDAVKFIEEYKRRTYSS